jgi:hypothetical protein
MNNNINNDGDSSESINGLDDPIISNDYKPHPGLNLDLSPTSSQKSLDSTKRLRKRLSVTFKHSATNIKSEKSTKKVIINDKRPENLKISDVDIQSQNFK